MSAMAGPCEKTVSAKHEVIEETHIQGPIEYNQIVPQMLHCVLGRSTKYDATAHMNNMSNTMFVHEVVDAYHNLHKKHAKRRK